MPEECIIYAYVLVGMTKSIAIAVLSAIGKGGNDQGIGRDTADPARPAGADLQAFLHY
jgi:hypothetical protein